MYVILSTQTLEKRQLRGQRRKLNNLCNNFLYNFEKLQKKLWNSRLTMADSKQIVGMTGKQNVSPARETMDILMEMSKLLNTGLDAETLMTCVRLCEGGVNPEALALVIKELRRESAAIKNSESSSQSIS